MAHRDFLIRYSNGFKRHVSKADLDLLGDSLTQVGPREYLCNISLQSDLEQTSGPDFLPGQFTIEHKQRRYSERMETPKHLIQRLPGLIEALARKGIAHELS